MYVLYVSNRRHPDSNWGVKDLQSSALPLGYVAFLHSYKRCILKQRKSLLKNIF